MNTTMKIKETGCGVSAVDRKALERQAKAALMELPPEVRYDLIREYAEKYGIQIQRIVRS